MEETMLRGKYRIRTRLRGRLPRPLLWLAPKGRGDCGGHEWYRAEGEIWRCYHCETGESHGSPLSEADQVLATAQALRVAADLPSSDANDRMIARLLGELDSSVHPLAEQMRAEPSEAARRLASSPDLT